MSGKERTNKVPNPSLGWPTPAEKAAEAAANEEWLANRGQIFDGGTMTITEFLEARIAEDEAAARAATKGPWEVRRGGDFQDIRIFDGSLWINVVDGSHQSPPHGEWIDSPDIDFIVHQSPARVLAECSAKRAIVEGVLGLERDRQTLLTDPWAHATYKHVMQWFIRPFAAVYKDHPSYQQEWNQA